MKTGNLNLQKIVDTLVAAGQLTRQEGRDMLLDMHARFERNRKEMECRLQGAFKHSVQTLSVPSRAEVDRLRKTIRILEERVASLERDLEA